ncbi:hypothetical protein ACLOJK_014781 [Asimina triloba]
MRGGQHGRWHRTATIVGGSKRRRAEAIAGSGVGVGADGCGGVGADGWRSLSMVGTMQADSLDCLIQGLPMREEKQTPSSLCCLDLAVVVDVDLRPRWIWDGLDAMIMMDDLDCPTGHSSSVGFAGDVAAFIFSVVCSFAGVVDGNDCWLWLHLAIMSIMRGSMSPVAAIAAALHGDGAPYRCSTGAS